MVLLVCLQVHSLFSLLGLSHAFVTSSGRLVGVVGLKEVWVQFSYWILHFCIYHSDILTMFYCTPLREAKKTTMYVVLICSGQIEGTPL